MSGEDVGPETPGNISGWPRTCRLTHHLVGPSGAEGVAATQKADPERRDCEGEENCMSEKTYHDAGPSIACSQECSPQELGQK
ncbi:hypothetical protein E2C01_058851 [Portunus trituberculatus]|uniref:Uncharacterized protein n=1 Tax=Portunus trituberculatus TaxID=210409 RepID=A0A5B7GWM6_PORTR|nr:hypothetical protein [Portunus trituberculatus]